MLILIFGPPGSGVSTVASKLSGVKIIAPSNSIPSGLGNLPLEAKHALIKAAHDTAVSSIEEWLEDHPKTATVAFDCNEPREAVLDQLLEKARSTKHSIVAIYVNVKIGVCEMRSATPYSCDVDVLKAAILKLKKAPITFLVLNNDVTTAELDNAVLDLRSKLCLDT